MALCAFVLLGSGVPSATAQSDSILQNVPPRPAKSQDSADGLGAVHPDLEIVAEALSTFTAALDGGTESRSRVKGTAAELRSLLQRGLVTDLQRVPEMWESSPEGR